MMSRHDSTAARRIAQWVLTALAFCATTGVLADGLETIPLHHRRAEELIPLLQPLVPPGSVITGTGDVLLVRADAVTLRQIQAALASLDRAPRQLLITVGQDTGATSRGAGVAGSATVSSGNVQVGVNRPPGTGTGAEVTAQAHRTRDDIRSVSSVRALEGYEAYVAVGQAVPLPTETVVGAGPRGTVYGRTTTYRDVHTGFYAVPRISGDQVVLEISPTQQQVGGGPHQPVVSGQSLTTTVTGRLGEWIPLGGVTDRREGSTAGLVTWGTRSDLTQYSAWVKVDEVR